MERLKQKVASSSSRVIASLQQAAMSGAGFQASSQAGSTSASFGPEESLGAEQATRCSSDNPRQSQQAFSTSTSAQAPAATAPPVSAAAAATTTSARLMAADATAHLTDNERKILLEVFKKEEQFQRDTIK